jgi:ribosomal protein L40E
MKKIPRWSIPILVALTPIIFIGLMMALMAIVSPGYGPWGQEAFFWGFVIALLFVGLWLFVILREPEIDISELREIEEKNRLKKDKKAAKRREKYDHSLDKICPKCDARNPQDSTICQSCYAPIEKLRN